MQNKLTKTDYILPSRSDWNAELGLADTIDIFMDMAMEHAELLKIGISEFNPKRLFWVAAKTKVHFNRPVKMAETVSFSTWPQMPGKIKGDRQYSFCTGDEVLGYGKTEWVVINSDTKAIQKLDGIYPAELEFCTDPGDPEDFDRLRDFKDGEPFGEYKVRCVDIDYGLHMNNVAYVRAIEGLFSSKEWDERAFRDFQIDYKKSCYEGDTLIFTKKEENGACYLKGALEDGNTIVLAKLS
ncbi:MAG: hypothetical protein IKI20_02475 [Lachnospiraceae bacterium]|nr:hypothetical protein [Lachnospiraceae bacterium]